MNRKHSSKNSRGFGSRRTNLSKNINRRASFEPLETRQLLSVTLPSIGPQLVRAGAPLNLALHATSTTANEPINYTVTVNNSSTANPNLTYTIPSGNTFLKLHVTYAGAAADPTDDFSGDLIFELYNDLAPTAVQNITQLVNQNFYNGLDFHRIISDFMIQGGGYQASNGDYRDPTQAPYNITPYANEISNDLKFTSSGVLALANTGQPSSNTSQFFITSGPQRFLDGGYTVFGFLVQGEDIRQKIANVPVHTNGQPPPRTEISVPDYPITIETASIISDTTDAVLRLKALTGATGSAEVTITATGANSHDSVTQTFHVDVSPDTATTTDNIAPVLTASSTFPVLAKITKDAGPTTVSISSIINNGAGTTTISDDPGAIVGGIAITTLNGLGTWKYSLDGGNTFTTIDKASISKSNALLLPKDAKLQYTPDGINSDKANLSFFAWDATTGTAGQRVDISQSGATGGTTAFSSTSDTAQFLVNDAPVLTAALPTMGTTDENTPITIILAGANYFINNGSGTTTVTDPNESDAKSLGGIAITGFTGNGLWEYALLFGPFHKLADVVNATNALILGNNGCKLRYTPDGLNGETATITYHAWDAFSGSSGKTADLSKSGSTGGTNSFSANSDTATLTVTAVNDAPVLTPGVPTPIVIGRAESNTPKVIPLSNFVTADQSKTSETRIQDIDAGAVIGGIAVVGITGNGTWEYSTDNGANFLPISASTSTSSALLLSKDAQLRYTPGSDNSVTATITYYAWDASDSKTSGDVVDLSQASAVGGATAFSTATDTGEIVVNNAPVLVKANPAISLGTTDEKTPLTQPLSFFINSAAGTQISDIDDGSTYAGGIALTGVIGKGTWAYSLDNGVTFTNIVATSVSDSSALLLPHEAQLKFTPDNKNGETPSITYRAWDKTSGTAGERFNLSGTGGTGGSSAFSSESDTATLTVTDVNDAPVLTPANPILGVTKKTDALDKNLSDFINQNSGTVIIDVDDNDVVGGIAVVGITGTGTWQYLIPGGEFQTITDVGEDMALLLPKDTQLRYIPSGAIDLETATITYHAWDATIGTAETKVDLTLTDATGGSTAFSTATDTATIYVNDAPVLTVANPSLGTAANTVTKTIDVGSFINNGTGTTTISDPNQTPYAGGIALIGVTGAGTWAYSLDGGSTFQNIAGTISKTTALLLPANAKLRYTPTGGSTGEAPTIKYIAWDKTTGQAGIPVNLGADGSTGGATAYSDIATPDTATLTLRAAPTNISLDNNKVNDNAASGTKVGSFTTTASDSDGIQFIYSPVSGDGDADNAAFTISPSGELRTAKTFDTTKTWEKSSYTIRVRTTDPTDPEHLFFEKTFTITLTDVTKPTVTINQQAGQADPTHSGSIYFVVTFSEPVTDFTAADIDLSGTAPGMKVQKITGSGKTYEVQVNGMTGSGTVIANILAGKAKDAAGNSNLASTSTDNTVTYTYNWASYMGTYRDDTFVFSPGATAGTWQVMCNSTIWTIPAGREGITIDGLGGNDTIKVVSITGNEKLEIDAGQGKLMLGNFEVDVTNMENSTYALVDLFCTVTTTTTHANDTIQMYGVAGSAGGKTFTASPTSAVLSLKGSSITAKNFDNVQAYIESGTGNTATFADSTGNDLYLISPIGADMMYRGNNTRYSAWGFNNVNATSATGSDEVRFYGKSGAQDTFVASSTEATYTNSSFVNKASGFKDVQAYIDPNNECTATLIGTTDTNRINRAVTSPLGAQLFVKESGTTKFQSSAWNFKHVNIQGNGGNDSADMYGYYKGEENPLKNTIVGDSQSVTQSGGSATGTYNYNLSGFATAKVIGNTANSDSVTLDNVTFNASDLPLDGNPYNGKIILNSIDELFTTTNKANPTPHAIDLVMKGYWE